MRKLISKLQKKHTADVTVYEKAFVYAYIKKHLLAYDKGGVIATFLGNLNEIICISDDILKSDILYGIDDLIFAFETLVCGCEKKNKGIVYTPAVIRNYICEKLLDTETVPKIIDPACGCGAFLVSAVVQLRKSFNISINKICQNYLYGCDIDKHSIKKSEVLLNILALQIEHKEMGELSNLQVVDSLDYFSLPQNKSQFDIVIGNPPYVRAKNIDKETRQFLPRWSVVTGNVDLYIPFYQIGMEITKADGKIGYISPNTFLQSVNGRGLRNYLRDKGIKGKIINFKDEQAFAGVTNYTCIAILKKGAQKSSIEYAICKQGNLDDLEYAHYNISEYDDNQEWRFGNTEVDSLIYKLEHQPHKLNDYGIKNGLATLSNDIYFFSSIREDESYYYRITDGKEFKIEKAICIDVAKPNIMRTEEDLKKRGEKAIFPYVNGQIIPEKDLKEKYPYAYLYLLKQKNVLLQRDKGDISKYPTWYAYGRTQGMNNYGKKLLVPYMADKGVAILSENEDLLFYCGYAVFSSDITTLKLLKILIESDVFLFYLKMTSKPYSKGFMALAKNYIKNFGIPELSSKQKRILLDEEYKEKEKYISGLYGINYDELLKLLQ